MFSFLSRGNGEITDSLHCSQKRHRRAEKTNQVEIVLEVDSVGLTLQCYQETVSEEEFGIEFAMKLEPAAVSLTPRRVVEGFFFAFYLLSVISDL